MQNKEGRKEKKYVHTYVVTGRLDNDNDLNNGDGSLLIDFQGVCLQDFQRFKRSVHSKKVRISTAKYERV